MKNLFFILFLISFFITGNASAQTFNCSGLAANRYYLNATIVVSCDTVFLLNKVTYSFYRNQVKKINTADPKLKEFVASQSELISLYENRVMEMGIQYAELLKAFNENLKKSSRFIESSTGDMTNIKSNLTKAQGNIAAAQDSISNVKSILVKDMSMLKKNNFKWGVGGVILGVLATLVLNGK